MNKEQLKEYIECGNHLLKTIFGFIELLLIKTVQNSNRLYIYSVIVNSFSNA